MFTCLSPSVEKRVACEPASVTVWPRWQGHLLSYLLCPLRWHVTARAPGAPDHQDRGQPRSAREKVPSRPARKDKDELGSIRSAGSLLTRPFLPGTSRTRRRGTEPKESHSVVVRHHERDGQRGTKLDARGFSRACGRDCSQDSRAPVIDAFYGLVRPCVERAARAQARRNAGLGCEWLITVASGEG